MQGSSPVICGGPTTRLEEQQWESVNRWRPGRPSVLGRPQDAVHAALSTASPSPAPASSDAALVAVHPAAAHREAADLEAANLLVVDVAKLYQQK